MNNNNNMPNIDDEPYATYSYICNRLLKEYSKCISKKDKSNDIKCNYNLYLLQNICMKPNGLIHMDDIIIPMIQNNT